MRWHGLVVTLGSTSTIAIFTHVPGAKTFGIITIAGLVFLISIEPIEYDLMGPILDLLAS